MGLYQNCSLGYVIIIKQRARINNPHYPVTNSHFAINIVFTWYLSVNSSNVVGMYIDTVHMTILGGAQRTAGSSSYHCVP